ncbi:hypothetical protein BAE44_0018708, partial [Dichanthelium oligosanthes]
LHAAGCVFNPGIYFSPSFKMQSYAFMGLMKTIASLVPAVEVQDKIFLQLEEYKKSTGDFGLPIAIRQREKFNPVAWWDNFGNGTLELQSLAVRVLSQCCSATGYERNWDIFKYLHSGKLSRLERSSFEKGMKTEIISCVIPTVSFYLQFTTVTQEPA